MILHGHIAGKQHVAEFDIIDHENRVADLRKSVLLVKADCAFIVFIHGEQQPACLSFVRDIDRMLQKCRAVSTTLPRAK